MELEKKFITILAIFFLISIPIWFLIFVPFFNRVPSNFSYQADVLSLDNFYDAQQHAFSGEKRSVTNFSYSATGQKDNVLLIKNSFNVHQVSGEKIFSVERVYGINAFSGAHMSGYGDRDRDGFLFAPRHLKKGQPLTYWHINYDAPAHLKFIEQENLFGLTVYHYETDYSDVRIDQTSNLTYLPGVPIERGVVVEPHLQVWFEPLTGQMVKYQDNTIAYFYDKKTGMKLEPWNKFSNVFTRESVLNQISSARSEKAKALIVETIVPLLFALFGTCLLAKRFSPSLSIIIAIGGLVALGILLTTNLSAKNSSHSIIIGIARWDDTPSITRNIDGFKQALAEADFKDGQDVKFLFPPAAERNENKFRSIIKDFLAEKVDLIYSLTTPGTLIAKEMTTSTPIIFSVVTYPVEAGLISSLEKSDNNLVGTRNWVSVESQLSNFLAIAPVHSIGFVHKKNEINSEIQLQEMQKVAKKNAISMVDLPVESPSDITIKLSEASSTFDSLYLACDTLAQSTDGENAITAYINTHDLPSFTCGESGVFKGSLIGTVADYYEIGKLSGEKAGLILSGVTPSALETDTVSRPFMYLNRLTSQRLHIPIPQEIQLKIHAIFP